MKDAELLDYNALGFIPGPHESEETFLKRVSFCQDLEKKLKEIEVIRFSPSKELAEKLHREIGVELPWVPIQYSNKSLAPWHGGCAWIFQQEEGGPKGAFFQLRRSFLHQEKVLGYTKDEIMLHESVHVLRMAFDEPAFEELLAYSTSNSPFRKFFGPIISKPFEATLFLILLFVPLLLSAYLGSFWTLLAWSLPLGLALFAFLRLFYRHKALQKTLTHLEEISGSLAKARHLLLRLTDQEIFSFSKLPLGKIKEIIYSGKTVTLRQQLLCALALKEDE